MKKLFVTLVMVLGLVSSIEARIIPPNLDYNLRLQRTTGLSKKHR